MHAWPLNCIKPFVTPWTVDRQAPPSTRFSRQECWSGLPFPPPGDLPDPGSKPVAPALSPALQVASLLPSHTGSPNIQYQTTVYWIEDRGYVFLLLEIQKHKFCDTILILNKLFVSFSFSGFCYVTVREVGEVKGVGDVCNDVINII